MQLEDTKPPVRHEQSRLELESISPQDHRSAAEVIPDAA